MPYNLYGKSSSSLLRIKTSFFEENEKHVINQRRIASIYKKQPLRTICKNCNKEISTNPDFTKEGIGYVLCSQCQHLNGIYQDTNEFNEAVYTENSGEDYAKIYRSESLESYNYRTVSIYLPKAEFLYNSLLDCGMNPHDLEYLDFGAGAGYFVAALKNMGLKRVSGTDVSKIMVDLGNTMMREKVLKIHRMAETDEILHSTEAQVVSMIGVLEHLQDPREVLNQIKSNKNIKFLFIKVPTFSLSVYLEIMSPEVFHRQLYGGHTHLYTEESLSYLCEEFGFDVIAQWWFGTDIVDLFRHISIALSKERCSEKLKWKWRQEFTSIIDAMQLEIDKKHFSSEVHMCLKKKHI